ncbi:MAG: hypothetical protein ACE37F_35490 [Nannocystaceae bacterium]|nr:hypothetical protein [bacterium]
MTAAAANTRLAARFDGSVGFYTYRRLTAWHRYSPEKGGFAPKPPHERDVFAPKTVSTVEVGESVVPEVVDEKADYGDLGDQWIYVFYRKGPVDGVAWFAEIHHPGGTKPPRMNPMTTKETRLTWSPGKKIEGEGREEAPHLPGLVAREEWEFAFVGVPFRLEDACIDMLEDEMHRLCTFERLSSYRYQAVVEAHGHTVPLLSKDFIVPVWMPLRVCQTLATDVRVANSLLANLSGVAGELDGGPFDPPEEFLEYAFCSALSGLMEDPQRAEKLRRAMKEERRFDPEKTVREHDLKVRAQTLLVYCLSSDLARVYDSDLHQILLNGYIDEHAPRALAVDQEIMLGLAMHQPGLLVLLRMFEGADPRFKHTSLFARPRSASARQRKLASSSKTAALSIGAAFLKAAAWRHAVEAGESLLADTGGLFDVVAPGVVKNLSLETETISAVLPKPGHAAGVETRVPVRRLVLSADDVTALDKVLKGVGVAGVLLDTINLGFALRDFEDAAKRHPQLVAQKTLAATGALVSLLAGIADFALDLKGAHITWRMTSRTVGLVGAALTALSTAVDIQRAYDRGDQDAGDALFISVSASVAGTMICWIAMSAELVALNVFGLVLLAVGALSAVVAEFLIDSDLEVFVKYSTFGKNAGKKGSAVWSPVPLDELAGSWRVQLVALQTILSTFAVGFGEFAKMEIDGEKLDSDLYDLRIFVGLVDAETSFELVWTWRASGGSGSISEVLANTGEPGGLHSRTRVHPKSGALYVDVPAPEQMLVDARAFIQSDPRRELHGEVSVVKKIRVADETVLIPSSGGLRWSYTWPGVHPDVVKRSNEG